MVYLLARSLNKDFKNHSASNVEHLLLLILWETVREVVLVRLFVFTKFCFLEALMGQYILCEEEITSRYGY